MQAPPLLQQAACAHTPNGPDESPAGCELTPRLPLPTRTPEPAVDEKPVWRRRRLDARSRTQIQHARIAGWRAWPIEHREGGGGGGWRIWDPHHGGCWVHREGRCEGRPMTGESQCKSARHSRCAGFQLPSRSHKYMSHSTCPPNCIPPTYNSSSIAKCAII